MDAVFSAIADNACGGFRQAPDQERAFGKLAALGKPQTFPKGHILENAGRGGGICQHCGVILSGQVVGYDYTQAGSEHIFIVHDAGGVYFENQVLLRNPAPISMRTTKPSEIVLLDRETLVAGMMEDFEITAFVIKDLADKFDWAMRTIRDMSEHSTLYRLCSLFLTFAQRYGSRQGDSVDIAEHFSHQSLACILHQNRVTVTRNLQSLIDQGLIARTGAHYAIPDILALELYRETLDAT